MEKKPYINVDELMPQVSLQEAVRFYGVALPELHRIGNETRCACFLNCGKEHQTGDRVLAIQADSPLKTWYCHHYGCGKSGNLVSLIDLVKPGASANGRPRGQRFKEIAADLKAMAEGRSGECPATPAPAPAAPPPPPKVNVPLKDSDNERARTLVHLESKFVVDVAQMTPAASAYFRRRPYLTPDVCQRWRMGFLPRDVGGEDRTGGTMRGRIVYSYCDQQGEVLTWFGRDPDFEAKHKAWQAGGRQEREPEKFHFVKGFHRGLELFGLSQLREEAKAEKLRQLGLLVVEGPNDVIRLDTLGIPALGLCSNTITREQAARLAQLAAAVSGGIVTVFLDCDEEGERGMKQCLGYLAQLTPVRLAWTSKMFGGKFAGMQPEQLTPEQWAEIEAFLVKGECAGWSLSENTTPRPA